VVEADEVRKGLPVLSLLERIMGIAFTADMARKPSSVVAIAVGPNRLSTLAGGKPPVLRTRAPRSWPPWDSAWLRPEG
jgi:hypothetical protein